MNLSSVIDQSLSQEMSIPARKSFQQGASLDPSFLTDNGKRSRNNILVTINSPDVILPIPDNKTDIANGFSLHFFAENNTSKPIAINQNSTFIPELVSPNGQVLKPKRVIRKDAGYNTPSRCALLQPGNSSEPKSFFSIGSQILWTKNQLQLKFFDSFGNIWIFENIKPADYQLRFSYDILGRTVSCYNDDAQNIEQIQGVGAAKGITPFIKLYLKPPISPQERAVEIDDIRFETIVPNGCLSIPSKQPEAKISTQIGLKITNHSTHAFRFSRYELELGIYKETRVRLGGEVYHDFNFAYNDPVLLQPNQSITFFYTGSLVRSHNGFLLRMVNKGVAGFGASLPGIGNYIAQFTYSRSSREGHDSILEGAELVKPELVNNYWVGKVITPQISFCIAEP